MKEYQAEQIRNVGLFSHGGAGKTSLAEAMLFQAGTINRLGRVEEGSTTTDYDPDEIKRHISVSTALAPCEWQECKINVLDTPGYADFIGEVVQAMRVVDCAVILLDAVSGLEVGTETAWQEAEKNGVARMFFVNKMERENANFDNTLQALRQRFGKGIVALQIPIGSQQNFKGVIDLLTMTAITDDNGTPQDIPADLREAAQSERDAMVETVVELDDELINKYLEGEEITADELKRAVRNGVSTGAVYPVLCGSALTNKAVAPLLDAIAAYMPNPLQSTVRTSDGEQPASALLKQNKTAALVWKTVSDPYVGRLNYFRVYSGTIQSDSHFWNPNKGRDERIGQVYTLMGKRQDPVPRVVAGDIGAIAKLQETATGDTMTAKENGVQLAGIQFPDPVFSAAISPKTKGDLDKLGPALAKMTEEDPTIRVERNHDTGETLMSGMGESHIDITADRMKRKFSVDVNVAVPKVAYRETISTSAKAQGRYKKQTGGHGMFGDTWIEVEPLPRDGQAEFVFEDRVVGGAVPKNFIPAVEKGIREALPEGVLAGFPVVAVKAILYDGSYHPVDSNEMSFKLAGALGFRKASENARPVLLEPIMDMSITVPDAYTGDIIGDLNSKRAQVLGMVPEDGFTTVQARAPYAEVRRYATDLRSITGARGKFTMKVSGYDEVPAHVAQQVIAEAKKEKEQEK
ncbi:MAG TPA: elongation factor G [Chloroflexota bacterium]|nr:elongation factor G [Chloroflexota bacterium]